VPHKSNVLKNAPEYATFALSRSLSDDPPDDLNPLNGQRVASVQAHLSAIL
jgi:hypothetical protein